jgi:hypothetical protein
MAMPHSMAMLITGLTHRCYGGDTVTQIDMCPRTILLELISFGVCHLPLGAVCIL